MKQLYGSRRVGWAAGLALVAGMVAFAGAQEPPHGRKYKPLPELSHITVTVVKGFDGKPMPHAAVVFHATINGRDDGSMEVKTDPEGKASIDVIEVGSDVSLQVIAHGFATYAEDLHAVGAEKAIEVRMVRPREQISQYQDNVDKASELKPGVQEPPHPVEQPARPAGDQPLAPAPTPAPNAPQTPPASSPQ
jgi:hypothetical protein